MSFSAVYTSNRVCGQFVKLLFCSFVCSGIWLVLKRVTYTDVPVYIRSNRLIFMQDTL